MTKREVPYTFQLDQTLHVLTHGGLLLAATRGGRDVDKLAETRTSMGVKVPCVTLDDCSVVYECEVVHHNDVLPEILMPDIVSRAYPRGDFHRLYYGQIMGTYAR